MYIYISVLYRFYTHQHRKLCSNISYLICVTKIIFTALGGLEIRVTQIFFLFFP